VSHWGLLLPGTEETWPPPAIAVLNWAFALTMKHEHKRRAVAIFFMGSLLDFKKDSNCNNAENRGILQAWLHFESHFASLPECERKSAADAFLARNVQRAIVFCQEFLAKHQSEACAFFAAGASCGKIFVV